MKLVKKNMITMVGEYINQGLFSYYSLINSSSYLIREVIPISIRAIVASTLAKGLYLGTSFQPPVNNLSAHFKEQTIAENRF